MSYMPYPARYDAAGFRRCGRSGLVLPPISLGLWQNFGGIDAFEPWLARLQSRITERALGEEAAQIPPEWYAGDWGALERLLERLYRRRERVPELILSARNSGREPFPNWKVKYA